MIIKIRHHIIILFTFYLFCISVDVKANTSKSEVWELFIKGRYNLSQNYFDEYSKNHKWFPYGLESEYNAILCSVYLNNADIENRLNRFIKAHPNHYRITLANYAIGNSYFYKQKYAESMQYYSLVEKSFLDKSAQLDLIYCMAYACLNEQKFEQAEYLLEEIKKHDSIYKYASCYYAGFIAFKQHKYEEAITNLTAACSHKSYYTVVPCMIAHVYYEQKKFDQLLDYLNKLEFAGIPFKNREEIKLLSAECYFFLHDYELAIELYEEYLSLTAYESDSQVRYRLAYSLFKIGEKNKAMNIFKDLAMQNDEIAQLSSYYSGILYLDEDKKIEALCAFNNARILFFNREILEEATIQYAKLNCEIGNFPEAVNALNDFKENYQTSIHLQEVNNLLSVAYLYTNDYDQAINYVSKSENPSKLTLSIYQKATFGKASQLFNDKDYEKAVNFFYKALENPLDNEIVTKTHVLLGDSLYIESQYKEAIEQYQRVIKNTTIKDLECQKALYGLGYAYISLNNYKEAIDAFEKLTLTKPFLMPIEWHYDVMLRLADCYYAIKNYSKALSLYDKLIQVQPAHVAYQKGIIYGILGNIDAAKTNFKTIFDDYTNTIYYEKALIESAMIELLANNYEKAVEAFTVFLEKRPYSLQVPDGLLNRATAYMNLKQYELAENDYCILLEKYPYSSIIQGALLGIQRACLAQNKPEQFNEYLSRYKELCPNKDTLEAVVFDEAKSLFYTQRYPVAIELLNSFVSNYPKSSLETEANFLIAESYYRLGKEMEALVQYKLISDSASLFHNKIICRIATISYGQEAFEDALKYYIQLKDCANGTKEVKYALHGIMKTSYLLKKYDITIETANLFISQGKLPSKTLNEALLFIAKSNIEEHKIQEAIPILIKIVSNNGDIFAAEAKYLIAFIEYKGMNYKKSLEILFELNKTFIYEEWKDKSFLLIADNYMALKEYFQANATLLSIIDNSNNSYIIAEAQCKLNELMSLK